MSGNMTRAIRLGERKLSPMSEVTTRYYVRFSVFDRPGVLAAVTTLATDHEVNIYDIEIAHSAEGPRGVLILLVDSGTVDTFVESLFADGYAVAQRALT